MHGSTGPTSSTKGSGTTGRRSSRFAEVSLLGVEWRSVDHALPPTRWMTAIGWSCARSTLLARDSYESKWLGKVGGSDDSMVMSAEDAIM